MRPHLRFALLTCLLVAPIALADDVPDTRFAETVEVSEVLLDILVTDRDGNVVLGLAPEDFVIEDEGEERRATGLSFYSNRFKMREGVVDEIQHPAPGEVLSDRHFVLFFHDPRAYGNGGNLLRRHLEATRRAKEWVQKEMLPGDWVAVASYDYKLKIQQDFTQDPEALERAIQNTAKGIDPANEWESRRPEISEGVPTLLNGLPSGKELRKETTRIYDAIRLLADSTRGIVGRKSLLLFTVGFGDVRQSGGLISEPDRRFYPPMKQALNDNNVAVYPINLVASSFNIQGNFLNQLAADSGGSYYENFVSFITPIKQIADENNGYYLLSYQAEHPSGENGYRDVKVRVKNPEFRVRARKGYRFGS